MLTLVRMRRHYQSLIWILNQAIRLLQKLRMSAQPFVPGNIFSTAGIQGVNGSVVNAVAYINPNRKAIKP